MVTALHKDHGVPEGIHQIHNWNFANESTRLAHVYLLKDIGKIARQIDTNTFWLLTNYSPITFIQIGGGSLDGYSHETLNQLIHLAYGGPFEGFSGAYKEILPNSSPFPTNIIWWSNSTKSEKIIEKIITRNTSQLPILIIYNVYSSDGITIEASAIDNITYNGVFEISRERTIL
jgi:hypothetical protein